MEDRLVRSRINPMMSHSRNKLHSPVPGTHSHNLHQTQIPLAPSIQRRPRRGNLSMKVCDLTQFYSPFSGGVKRYIEEKRKYANALGHEHLLIVPGARTEKI